MSMLNPPTTGRRNSTATSNADGHSEHSSNPMNRSTSHSPGHGTGGAGGSDSNKVNMDGVITIGATTQDSPRIAPLGTLRAVGVGHNIQIVETKGAGNDSDVAAASRNTFRGVGHTKFILTIAFSPDGSLVASGSGDQLVILWDVKTGARRSALIGHNSGVRSVQFSHDGLFLASGSSDHNVILWDVLRGNQRAQLKGHSMEVNAVCFAPDSSFLYTAGVDKTIFVWDLRSPVVQLLTKITGHSGHIQALAASPDGNFLLSTGSDRRIIVWDARLEYKQVNELSRHTREIHTIAFSNDGTQFATGGSDSLVIVWNAATFSEQHVLKGHTNRVMSVAFSASGNLLASASMDKSIGIWDPIKGGMMKGQLYEHGHQVYSVSFPRGLVGGDGKHHKDGSNAAPLLASGSFSSNFILWDIVRGRITSVLEGCHKESNVSKVEWVQLPEASHRLLVRSTDFGGDEFLWDAESGRTTQLERIIEQESKLREMDDMRIHQEKMIKLAKQRQQQADAEQKAAAARKGANGEDLAGEGSLAGFGGGGGDGDGMEMSPSMSFDPAAVSKLESMISALPNKIASAVASPQSLARRKLTDALDKSHNDHSATSGNQLDSHHGGAAGDGMSQFSAGDQQESMMGGAQQSFGAFGKKSSFSFGGGGGGRGGGDGGGGGMDTDAILGAIGEVKEEQKRMAKDMQDLQKDVGAMQAEFKTISQSLVEVIKMLSKKS